MKATLEFDFDVDGDEKMHRGMMNYVMYSDALWDISQLLTDYRSHKDLSGMNAEDLMEEIGDKIGEIMEVLR